MDRQIIPPADGSGAMRVPQGTSRPPVVRSRVNPVNFGRESMPPNESPIWHLVFVGLIAWQGWMTLTLFGPEHPWDRLRDDQPILSGRHPLHFYHGILGAESLRERGRLSSYDPAFQAAHPKTPLFDPGSRPAELFLTLGGGGYRPAA